MRRMRWAALLALLPLVSGCTDITVDGPGWDGWGNWDDGTFRVRGSGVVATQTYDVADFDGITTWGVGTVIIERTGREQLTVTGDDNVLSYLDIEVQNRTLMLGPEPGVNLSLRAELVFRVEVAELVSVSASGAIELEAELDHQAALRLTMSGATAFEGTGHVDDLDVSVSGATRFDGRALQTGRTKLDASGTSIATVWATDRLEGHASGVSLIRYLGDPIVDLSVSGLATVVPY
jgi:hypothetical protein